MNIVTPFPSININTANVYTETARRDNQLREVIPAPSANSASNTETKAQSDAEKAKLPGNNEGTTYSASGKLADEKVVQARDDENAENPESSEEQKAQQQESEQEQQVLEQEQQQIKELKARDTEVRIHEQAHASVGGKYAGSPSYEYQRGPDGTNYAVGGEVQIDVAEIPGDPQATIEKMQTVRAAALAPAEPSGADRSIAADATQKLVAAQAELAAPQNDEDDSAENNSKASFTSSETQETKTADSEQQTRDADVEARAGRIANFYQMATSPSTQSGFSAIS
ncbi:MULTISPECIES: putative metalloprotease CJM1_0395 family protein [unclassified Pseudoalteromonas]|uniref:putative metalloprotease CJM1_0395 family protein n=1 Tax=unclassified Pseudoalteromonas TaxID=194690 RepID=UPI0011093258|nr:MULTISPECIES: putative metalloprotease CJM1_0395 family protein [unclassified Pseudoalteromonas]TMN80927.1 catalase [Pseudoalteromonas sp. S410]TMN87783.1 catalase [Pseudoalteromonas sp. S408]TMN94829.1 catalase [Pseudoalteromonas sp. S407]TMO02471.1 catalase [Pseudoalteromonas sp. S409]TMO08791.1 catalase [Pseudoalteromonas sp. S186]